MSRVTLKIPQNLKRVKILKSEEVRQKEEELRRLESKKILEEKRRLRKLKQLEMKKKLIDEARLKQKRKIEEKLRLEEERRRLEALKEKKPVFSEEFVISNSGVPLEINLNDVKEEAIPISEVKEEVQDAYDRGFRDGQDAGRVNFEEELKTQREWARNIDAVASELRKEFAVRMRDFQNALAETSVLVAENILTREIAADSKIVIEQARKALSALDGERVFRIRLNPEDIEILENVKSALTNDPSTTKDVELSPDSSVERGGCLLETAAGNVDARLRTQLEVLRAALEESVKDAESEEFSDEIEINGNENEESAENNNSEFDGASHENEMQDEDSDKNAN